MAERTRRGGSSIGGNRPKSEGMPGALERKQTVAVGMSGGVDSTVAALILRDQGYDLIGITMQIWDGSVELRGGGRSGCFGPGETQDIEFAKVVSEKLGFPHFVVPLAADYGHCVLEYFRDEYHVGRTPNPCIVCNQRLKFGLLLEKARGMGIAFDAFATGHYARVSYDQDRGSYRLFCALDKGKDQSYFLARLRQEQLRNVIFPLGELCKSEVVCRARSAGFVAVADREESQDFIESRDYTSLFRPDECTQGPIVDSEGHALGRHRGLIHYTVGQRKGLGVSSSERLYVKELIPRTNTVVLGRVEEVQSRTCLVEDASWISGYPPSAGADIQVRIRYHHGGVRASLQPLDDGRWSVEFIEPQFAVTPGQGAVFYDGEEVLGGGWIGENR